jgi:hypothetical protein
MSKYIKCIFCKTDARVDRGVKAILCPACTARVAGTPTQIGKVPKVAKAEKKAKVKKVARKVKTAATASTGRGRGWHLKKHFVDVDGTVYSFGKPV